MISSNPNRLPKAHLPIPSQGGEGFNVRIWEDTRIQPVTSLEAYPVTTAAERQTGEERRKVGTCPT